MKLALCTGFYFNTARRMHNSEDSYLMIYPEGTVVDMDTTSIYSVVNQYPETVIFTELGGTSLVRGVMRLVTEIDIEIVKPLFSMMTKVDLFRLAKMEFQQQGRQQLFEKRQKNEEEKKIQQVKEEQVKKEKLAQYIQNYQARKKQKK